MRALAGPPAPNSGDAAHPAEPSRGTACGRNRGLRVGAAHCALGYAILLTGMGCGVDTLSLGNDELRDVQGVVSLEAGLDASSDRDGQTDAGPHNPDRQRDHREPCGRSLCEEGTICCSHSCGLCTPADQCWPIECGGPGHRTCRADECPAEDGGSGPELCSDGRLGGRLCLHSPEGPCEWVERPCQSFPPLQLCGMRDTPPCDEDSVCSVGCGDRNAPGLCFPRPTSCGDRSEPVCGCDAETYDNGCLAAMEGVSIDHAGPCEEPGAHCTRAGRPGCPPGEYCDLSEGDGCLSSGDPRGVCRARPQNCPREFRPVCGCDGRTYASSCIAATASQNVAYPGECWGQTDGQTCGTQAQLPCPYGTYCDLAAGDGCGGPDAAGLCASKPAFCTLEYAPVCGCDGRTYGNRCDAALQGVSLLSEGECDR